MTGMFQRLAVHQKVILILSMTVLPVLGVLVLYVTTIGRLQAVEQEVNRFFELQLQTEHILEQIVDVQYGFRGFVLTKDEKFLTPYYAATESLAPTIHRLREMVGENEDHLRRIADVEARIRLLLQQKQRLIDNVRLGQMEPVRRYIESGQGQAALNEIRSTLRDFVASEMAIRQTLQERADRLAAFSSYGLAGGIAAMVVMWWLGGRLLARAITGPISTLTSSAQQFGISGVRQAIPISSADELGRLARTMEEMQERVAGHVHQAEAVQAIGKEVNTIGPDGLEGVLKRIAERAGDVLNVDLCLVLLWNEAIGCWKVGAASGHWHDLLRRSVLIREETPISFQALTTGLPQAIENLEARPEAVLQIRDRFGGKSLLSVPLLGPQGAFGVLAFVPTRQRRTFADRDVRLAQQFADWAAIAILNVRLYETAQQRGEGLESRLKQVERYAADMAHDLKGPARRMAELASLLQMDYKGRFDERADRYLAWIRENGQQLMARIEEVLRLARIGTAPETVEPVDPAEVVRDVLKGCESHIERLGATVRMTDRFPKLACNRVHLFQVLDNLIRNALKFSAERRPPELEIGILQSAKETVLFVRDNGIGIAPADRERIFEPFERLGHKEAPGTGIGLAIVRKIIELYQGRVWVESEPGKGATVFFTLPLYGELAAVEAVQEGVQS